MADTKGGLWIPDGSPAPAGVELADPLTEAKEVFQRDFKEKIIEDATLYPFTMTLLLAWELLATIQLALRHPEYPRHIRAHTEPFARDLQSHLALTPALWRVIENGWKDVPA